MRRRNLVARITPYLLGALLVAACEGVEVKDQYPRPLPGRGSDPSPEATRESLFGGGGFGSTIFGTGSREEAAKGARGGTGVGIGVNSYLWRASLDTMSFMPLASADPFGGVIITDWYSPPESPEERFKATVYILERQLRADGVRVAVFRQTRAGGQDWRDARLNDRTATDLEDAILTRARQLRISSLGE